jgi:hypothetical protein
MVFCSKDGGSRLLRNVGSNTGFRGASAAWLFAPEELVSMYQTTRRDIPAKRSLPIYYS